MNERSRNNSSLMSHTQYAHLSSMDDSVHKRDNRRSSHQRHGDKTLLGSASNNKTANKVKANRQVRFATLPPTQVEVANREDLTEEDHAALWFNVDEFATLKAQARIEADAYNTKSSSASLDYVFCEKSKEAQQQLTDFCAQTNLRGLERMRSPVLSNKRQQAQFQALMDVLRVQDEHHMYHDSSGATKEDVIRKTYQQHTKVARHFARMMAKADAQAVGMPYESHLDPHHHHHTDSSSPNKKERLLSSTKPSASSKLRSSDDGGKKKHSSTKEKKDKKSKDSSHETPKQHAKSSLKQKYKDTKAGIIARIPRIA